MVISKVKKMSMPLYQEQEEEKGSFDQGQQYGVIIIINNNIRSKVRRLDNIFIVEELDTYKIIVGIIRIEKVQVQEEATIILEKETTIILEVAITTIERNFITT